MHGMRHAAGIEDVWHKTVKIRGDNDQWLVEVGKGFVPQVAFKMPAQLFTADQSFGRWDDEIHQCFQSGAVFDFPRALLKLPAIESSSPE